MSEVTQPAYEGRIIRTAPKVYEADTRARILAWQAEGRVLSLDEIMIYVSPGQPANSLIRDYAINNHKIKGKDFDAAVRREVIIDRLDRMPRAASDLVAILAEQMGLTVAVNGLVSRNEPPFMDHTYPDGTITRIPITREDQQRDSMQEYVRFHFQGSLQLQAFRRQARIIAAELRLPFARDDINDAVHQWHAMARREREFKLRDQVIYTALPYFQAEAKAALVNLCGRIFDMREHPAEYVAAAVQKFIWQVKRKMLGIPVTNHQMLVLLGRQGGGKSTFMDALTAPLSEMTARIDFREITDQRNIDLWSNYVGIVDEMGWASKSDIETIKNVITSPALFRRVLGTNTNETVTQNVTFIGASNKESLSDLIRDESGVRRFVSLRYADHPDWEATNAFQWIPVWEAVDPHGPDPMLKVADLMKHRQEDDRERGVVELWIESLSPTPADPREDGQRHPVDHVSYHPAQVLNRRLCTETMFPANDLYATFKSWEEEHHPSTARITSLSRWGRDLKALRLAGRCPFEAASRSAAGKRYRYDGPRGAAA